MCTITGAAVSENQHEFEATVTSVLLSTGVRRNGLWWANTAEGDHVGRSLLISWNIAFRIRLRQGSKLEHAVDL